MKAKFTIEIEATKDEIDAFTNNINRFVYKNNNLLVDVKPIGGYIPRFYLPTRKKRMDFKRKKRVIHDRSTENTWKDKKIS